MLCAACIDKSGKYSAQEIIAAGSQADAQSQETGQFCGGFLEVFFKKEFVSVQNEVSGRRQNKREIVCSLFFSEQECESVGPGNG